MAAAEASPSEAPLPPAGVDLRAELVALQRRRVEQAIERSGDDAIGAARLLGLTLVEFERIRAAVLGEPRRRGRGGRPKSPPSARPSPSTPTSDEVSRIENGVEIVSRDAIRRLAREGFTPRQIANRFGVHAFFIEKILRAEAELAKCPAPSRRRPSNDVT